MSETITVLDRGYYYYVGGTVPWDSPSYVKRDADHQLYEALTDGKFCYVFNSRQKGKSSLEGHVRKRLEADGWTCAFVDITNIGTESVKSVEQWYRSLLQSLSDALALGIHVSKWWREQGDLTPLSYLTRFFEEIFLAQIDGPILIAIDEIDSVLSLKFPTDDFFAFIRSCYNKRSNHPDYRRLTFLLLGVASPTDLMIDKTRTPFNIGKAINLTRLEKKDIKPLSQGLDGIVVDPFAVVEEIWNWTDGHPFLTQKLCHIIQENRISIAAGSEEAKICDIVEKYVIRNWKDNDHPEHLLTIEKRILKDKDNASALLNLYKVIQRNESLPADSSSEQTELRLSGIVIKEDEKIRVANRIYATIFSQDWVEQLLSTLKPYSEAMAGWAKTDEDSSWLLHGNALQKSLQWINGHTLDDLDRNFITASQSYAKQLFLEALDTQIKSNQVECDRLIQEQGDDLRNISENHQAIIDEMYAWTGVSPQLFQRILDHILRENKKIAIGDEKVTIAQEVTSAILTEWGQNTVAEHLNNIQDELLQYKQRKQILTLYKSILKGDLIAIDDRPNLMALMKSGLIIHDSKKQLLVVANPIYKTCFNQEWVEDQLTKIDNISLIRNQYLIKRKISESDAISAYDVQDNSDPGGSQYLAIKFDPKFYTDNEQSFSDFQQFFSGISQTLGATKEIDQVPKFIATFEDDGLFYIIQEYNKGMTLSARIMTESTDQLSLVQLLINVLDILDKIHSAGLFHLNLCPDNILQRESDGKTVLLNFAIFQAIAAQAIKTDKSGNSLKIGMAGYAAPELSRRQPDVTSDLYALGMIAVQMLTGRHPIDLPTDVNEQSKIWRYATLGNDLPSINPGLIEVIDKMIHPHVSDRYQSAAEVIDALNHLQDTYSSANKQRQRDKFQKIIRRVLVPLGSAGLVAGGFVMAANSGERLATAYHTDVCQQHIQLSTESTPPSLFDSTNIELAKSASIVQESCTQLINEDIIQTGKHNVYLKRGQSRIILWHQEKKLEDKSGHTTASLLEDAMTDFRNVSDGYAEAKFYLGIINAIKTGTRPDQESDYSEAIKQYLQLITDPQTKNIKDFEDIQDNDIRNVSEHEIPVLVKLALWRIAENDSEPEDIKTAKHLLDIAIKLYPDNLPLKYSQAMIDAKVGNNRQAIDDLTAILETIDTDELQGDYGELVNQIYQSRSFLHLQLAIRSDFHRAEAKKDLIKASKNGLLPPYIDRKCTTNLSSCDIPKIIDQLSEDASLNGGFPVFPIYDCRSNPALAIAEQALIDRGLELESTKLCR